MPSTEYQYSLYVLDGNQLKKVSIIDGSVKASTSPQPSDLVALTFDSSHLYVADKAGYIKAFHLSDLTPAGGSSTPVLSDPRALAMATPSMATGLLYALDGKYVQGYKIEPVNVLIDITTPRRKIPPGKINITPARLERIQTRNIQMLLPATSTTTTTLLIRELLPIRRILP